VVIVTLYLLSCHYFRYYFLIDTSYNKWYISKHMKLLFDKIRVFLPLSALLGLGLLGCTPETRTEVVIISTQPASTVTTQEVDRPRMTEEEAASQIFNSLVSKLPVEYKAEQLDLDTRKVLYSGQGRWEFAIQGSGKKVTELPEEKLEKSDILWVYTKKELTYTYDLVIVADYFENTGICEIKSLIKKNENTSVDIVSSREVEARMKVKLVKLQYFANRLQVQMTLENTGYVPLNGIVMNMSYNKPLREISSTNFEDILYPEKTVVLLKLYEDENIRDFGYPDNLTFTTGAGTQIPFTVAENAYSVNNY
jgi:hypothetical protein